MRKHALRLALALSFVVALGTACGGGDDEPPTPAGAPVSDTEYLAVLCTGLTDYRIALNSQPQPAGISAVVRDYIAKMEQVRPADDLAKWHESYLAYLEGVVEEPTRGITQDPPLPPEDARKRLAGLVLTVPECEYRTFLGEDRPQ